MFFEVLSAINDPNQQASVGQLDQITRSVQQLASSQGMNPSQMQSIMTVLGGALQPVLQQKQSQLGTEQLASMLGQGNQPSALTSILSPEIQQHLIQTVTQKTGMQLPVAQAMLPKLLPIVLELFNMGASKTGSVGSKNPLLETFLNSDRTGNADLGHVLKFAGRFLSTSP